MTGALSTSSLVVEFLSLLVLLGFEMRLIHREMVAMQQSQWLETTHRVDGQPLAVNMALKPNPVSRGREFKTGRKKRHSAWGCVA